ncbi:hypothetical protein [Sphingomonas sp. HMP9]|nr:hypothetical protein [Sphingomonas sp. HMP9]
MLVSPLVRGTHSLIDLMLGTIVVLAAIATLHCLMSRRITGVAAARLPR